MATMAMSSGPKCATEGAPSAMSAADAEGNPTATEAGTSPYIASPEAGEFVRGAFGRSPLSKWVYSNPCQEAYGCRAKKARTGPGPAWKPGQQDNSRRRGWVSVCRTKYMTSRASQGDRRHKLPPRRQAGFPVHGHRHLPRTELHSGECSSKEGSVRSGECSSGPCLARRDRRVCAANHLWTCKIGRALRRERA